MGNAKEIPMPDGLERVIEETEANMDTKAVFTVFVTDEQKIVYSLLYTSIDANLYYFIEGLIEAGQNDLNIKTAILRAAEILKTVK